MEEEYLKRWRLILGGAEADGTNVPLNIEEQRIDRSLEAIYDSDRKGGLGSSAPKVSRWLGDIREFFPSDCRADYSEGCGQEAESHFSTDREGDASDGGA